MDTERIIAGIGVLLIACALCCCGGGSASVTWGRPPTAEVRATQYVPGAPIWYVPGDSSPGYIQSPGRCDAHDPSIPSGSLSPDKP